jgi:hypothetical protein
MNEQPQVFITERGPKIGILLWAMGAFITWESVYKSIFDPHDTNYGESIPIKCLFFLLGLFFAGFATVFALFTPICFTRDTIVILTGNKHRDYQWQDVEKITQIKCFAPPLYYLKLKDKRKYLFCSGDEYAFLLAYCEDLSELGRLIDEKKEALLSQEKTRA